MKKSTAIHALIASALVTSAAAASVGIVQAAVPKPAVKSGASSNASYKVLNSSLNVDGQHVAVPAIQVNQIQLYSLRHLTEALGGAVTVQDGSLKLNDAYGYHTVVLRPNSKDFTVDGENRKFTITPVSQGGTLYVELSPVLMALGGEKDQEHIYSLKRLEGTFSGPHFDTKGQILVTREYEEGMQIFRLSPQAGTPFQVFSSSEGAQAAVISPDGAWGAYTDDSGRVQLMNMSSGRVHPLGTDTSVKTDMVWSGDGTRIYFIQGDKQEKVAYISVDTEKVTEVLADKVENKSDLQVSEDGKKIAYLVNITGVAKNDADSTEDSLTIDYSGAGAQVFTLDTTAKGAKPVQLTKTPDNKLYLNLLADGTLVYVSADSEGTRGSILKSLSPDGTAKDLVSDIDVTLATAAGKNRLIVAGTAADDSSRVYEVSLQKLFRCTLRLTV